MNGYRFRLTFAVLLVAKDSGVKGSTAVTGTATGNIDAEYEALVASYEGSLV